MTGTTRHTLYLIHDLAYLYLGLAHRVDERLDPRQVRIITGKLHDWLPDKNPALIAHVVREASLSYLNRPDQRRLEHIAQALGEALPGVLRAVVLRDLLDIARADAAGVAVEGGFIRRIASAWQVPPEEERPCC